MKKAINHWHTDLDPMLAGRMPPAANLERRALLPLVSTIVEVAIVSRRDTILALEKLREQIEDKDLSTGLRMLIDGVEPQDVVAWFRNRIVFSDICGLELLRLLIVGTALHALGSGCNPDFIREFLYSYLGEEIVSGLRNSFV